MSYKIDFTTFKDQLNAMPIAKSSFTITSQNISIGLIRVGNLVIAESAKEVVRFDPATSEITVNIAGFEPAHGVNIIFTSVKGEKATMGLSKNSEQVGTNKWSFSTAGFSTLSSFRAATIWLTNDPWPTS